MKDDIEVYVPCESLKVMAAQEIHKDQWPHHLVSQLTEKVQLEIVVMSSTSKDYDAIKVTITNRNDANKIMYHRQFS